MISTRSGGVQAAAQAQSGGVALQMAFESAIRESEQRVTRTWLTLLSTGAVGGIDVSIGVLGFLLVMGATGSAIAGSLAFGIGFLALTLANSELFTENFFVSIAALVAHRAPEPGAPLGRHAGQ